LSDFVPLLLLLSSFNALSSLWSSAFVQQRGVLVIVGLFGGAARISLPHIALCAKRIQGVHVGRLQDLQELLTLITKIKV